MARDPAQDASGSPERRSGELTLAGRRWEWEAVHAPPEDEEGTGSPFLRWYEITFRLADDPEQRAVARAGIPARDWSEGTLREVLRSARSRRWRDPEGELWSVRLEGWSGRGISTEVAAAAEDAGRAVVFVHEEGGDEVRRSAPGCDSITDPPSGGLEALLEGEE